MDAAAVEGLNPMFNDQFSSVLKDALSRQGASSLFSGPIQADPPPDKRCGLTPGCDGSKRKARLAARS